MWPTIHAERAALLADLEGLSDEQWAQPSLCGEWTIRETVAHLTAVARIGTGAWLRSVIGVRFDFDRHNADRLAEQLGSDASETLARFRAASALRVRIIGPKMAAIGETVIHAADIRRPLGLSSHTQPATAADLLHWYATHEFNVISKSRVHGLHLVAEDADLTIGDGPVVRGPALSLLMATCGRSAYLDDLSGDGLDSLAARCHPGWTPRP